MNVLVVDDSAFLRRVISQMIASDPALKVIDTARNGQEGLEKAKALRPDVVTLDIEMPVMDGLEALRRIRAECADPRPEVIMCSSLTTAGSEAAIRALHAGAADVIAKDTQGLMAGQDTLRADLLAKIKALGGARRRRLAMREGAGGRAGAAAGGGATPAPPRIPALRASQFDVLLVGSSTGGPPALEAFLRGVQTPPAVPVVIAQHMPALFTASLSERLGRECGLPVVHADASCALRPGVVHVIVGGKHGHVAGTARSWRLEVNSEPTDALYRPSVNALFASVERCGARALGVVLTGMGDDGAQGARSVRGRGGVVLCQDAESCVVYGMPRAVVEAGLCDGAGTPEALGRAVRAMGGDARCGRAAA